MKNKNQPEYELSTEVNVTPQQQHDRLIKLGTGIYRDKISGKILYKYDEMPAAEVVGHKKKKSVNDNWQKAYAKGVHSGTMASDMETMNAVTGGALNWTMPSQLVGATGRLINDRDFGQFGRNLILGNNGIVTDKFAQEHPWYSMGANLLFDGAALGTPKVVKTTYNLRPSNLRRYIFYNISPLGYDNAKARIFKAVKSAASGEYIDIDNPEWFNEKNAKLLENYNLLRDSKDFGERALKARFDAWRKYLGLPQKYNTWTPSTTKTGYFTDTKNVGKLIELPAYNNIDFVNSAGGGTSTHMRTLATDAAGNEYGFTHITDLWDLQPFQKSLLDFQTTKVAPLYAKTIGRPFRVFGKFLKNQGENLSYKNKDAQQYLKNANEFEVEMFDPEMFARNGWMYNAGKKLQNLGEIIYNKGFYNSKNSILSKVGNIEMSQLIPGAKPFNIEYTIPWTGRINPETYTRTMYRGFNPQNVLPPEVIDFKQKFPNLDYTYKGPKLK